VDLLVTKHDRGNQNMELRKAGRAESINSQEIIANFGKEI